MNTGGGTLLQSLVDKVGACQEKTKFRHQYAAIDAYIDNFELPYINGTLMCSSTPDVFTSCTNTELREVSTVCILASKYNSIKNFIIFTQSTYDYKDYASTILSVCKSSKPKSVVIVGSNTNAKYSTYVTDIGYIRISEKELFDSIELLTHGSTSFLWCSSVQSIALVTHMSLGANCMWINSTTTSTSSVSIQGESASAIMPLFYSDCRSGNLITVNFGRVTTVAQGSRANTQLRANTVIRDVLNSVSKTHKCYYCSMLAMALSNSDAQFTITPREYTMTVASGLLD